LAINLNIVVTSKPVDGLLYYSYEYCSYLNDLGINARVVIICHKNFSKDDLDEYKEFLLNHPSKIPGKTYDINTVNQRLNHLKKFFQICKYEFGEKIDLFIETEKVQQQNIIDKMLENDDARKMINKNVI
jgi:predicted metal-dependent phosphotriesterase family hydrolase